MGEYSWEITLLEFIFLLKNAELQNRKNDLQSQEIQKKDKNVEKADSDGNKAKTSSYVPILRRDNPDF